jgi:putative membrane protein (TIGR04086 family)
MRDQLSGGISPAAVGRGLLWGLAALVGGGVALGLVGYRTPLDPATEEWLRWGWHSAAALLGGFSAGRRATGSGWMHGALSGAVLVLAVAAIMGIASGFPPAGALLRLLGVAMVAGALGGIAGVNLRR